MVPLMGFFYILAPFLAFFARGGGVIYLLFICYVLVFFLSLVFLYYKLFCSTLNVIDFIQLYILIW